LQIDQGRFAAIKFVFELETTNALPLQERDTFALGDDLFVRRPLLLSVLEWHMSHTAQGGAMSVVPHSDVAYRVLKLEQQLDSYQHLHAEELKQIRQAVEELKALVLMLAAQEQAPAETNSRAPL
jgi:hypothetical protein